MDGGCLERGPRRRTPARMREARTRPEDQAHPIAGIAASRQTASRRGRGRSRRLGTIDTHDVESLPSSKRANRTKRQARNRERLAGLHDARAWCAPASPTQRHKLAENMTRLAIKSPIDSSQRGSCRSAGCCRRQDDGRSRRHSRSVTARPPYVQMSQGGPEQLQHL